MVNELLVFKPLKFYCIYHVITCTQSKTQGKIYFSSTLSYCSKLIRSDQLFYPVSKSVLAEEHEKIDHFRYYIHFDSQCFSLYGQIWQWGQNSPEKQYCILGCSQTGSLRIMSAEGVIFYCVTAY